MPLFIVIAATVTVATDTDAVGGNGKADITHALHLDKVKTYIWVHFVTDTDTEQNDTDKFLVKWNRTFSKNAD